MNRRGFLKALATAAAGAVASTIDDPERLIWVPGQKTYFLPLEKVLVSKQEVVNFMLAELPVPVDFQALEAKAQGRVLDSHGRRYTITTREGSMYYNSDWKLLGGQDDRGNYLEGEKARYMDRDFLSGKITSYYMTDDQERVKSPSGPPRHYFKGNARY